jgi:hypothetical protein
VGLEAEGRPIARRLGHPLPAAVGTEDPGIDLVAEGGVENVEEPLA